MYGDGKRVMDVDDGTADNAVIDVSELCLSSVTVRTKSNDKLSAESSSCPVPAVLRADKNQKERNRSNEDSDSDSELIEKLQNHPVMSGPPRSRELIINYGGFPDIDSDIGPSELSDIAEEPEDEYTDSENDRITTPKNKNNSSSTKFDIMNMYKTPHINNNLWRPNAKKPETNASSQIISSHLESQKFTNPTNNNKNVVKGEQKNNNTQHTAANLANNRNERMRIFVALFDYDPPSMSPNPDACEEELPFREGQLIKVYGEKDADGFYWGEAGSRSGFVPCNMVSEVQVRRGILQWKYQSGETSHFNRL